MAILDGAEVATPIDRPSTMATTATTTTMSSSSHHASHQQLSNASSVREWLMANHKRQLIVLDHFASELQRSRWRQGSGRSGGDTSDGLSDPATLASSSAASLNDQWVVALKTVDVLRHLVGSTRWKSPAQLLVLLRGVGNELHGATTTTTTNRSPAGLGVVVVGNMVRRVMAATREEAMRDQQQQQQQLQPHQSASSSSGTSSSTPAADGRLSLQSMLWALPQHVKSRPSSYRGHHDPHQRQESFGSVSDLQPQDSTSVDNASTSYPPGYYSTRPDLKHSIMEAIQEMVGELEDVYRNVNEQSTTHVHSGEIILTMGRSNTVYEFLKSAALKNRNFTVLVCEGSNGGGASTVGGGREQAALLAAAGIDVTLLPYSSMFAVMSRVNKVILPAHAVLANGGLVSVAGSNATALAAHHHSVPVVCVSGLFKLTPLFPHDGQDTLNDLVSPMMTGPGSGIDLRDPSLRDVEYVCPVHDYVKPEHIRLYVTNVGSFQPNYTYRLLAEYYHVDDWESFG